MAPPLLPITRLVPCPGCEAHVKRGELLCPHCGAAVDGRGGLAARVGLAAMTGLLSSCLTAEPAYGVATEFGTGTETETDSDATAGTETEGSSGTEAATEATSGTGTTQATAEPDYGVPTTDATTGTGTGTASTAGESDYGMPAL